MKGEENRNYSIDLYWEPTKRLVVRGLEFKQSKVKRRRTPLQAAGYRVFKIN